MNVSENTSDHHFDYLVDCDANKMLSKSDAIRSKLFQLNSLQNTFNSEVFNKLRLDLMNELSKEIDRKDGKNTYLGPATHFANMSSRDEKINEWNSHLFSLSEQQIFKRFNINKRTINQIKNKEKVIALKKEPNQNDNKCDSSDSTMSDVCIVNDDKAHKNNLFDRVGTFSKSNNNCASKPTFKSPQFKSCPQAESKTKTTENSSPTRVPGIFKRNNGNNSPSNRNTQTQRTSDNTSSQIEFGSKRTFVTGLERKLVDDVKNKKMDLNKAKKVLNEVRQQPFRNPLKSENETKLESAKSDNELLNDERLKNIDPLMIEAIQSEIISNLEPIEWSKIAGLEFAKSKIREIAILPLLRPDLFTRIRVPPKGILLFGPPGTGKTLIGRCIASQTKSTFFSFTVSSFTSKWIGDGEKMIRAMFAVARTKQPAVIFIDEIDSLLKTRCDTEHESSRRMKTEFLAQFEGVTTNSNERLLIIGATNRPQELDDAARRRLSAKLYIPLPDREARKQIITNCIGCENHNLTDEQIDDLAHKTEGYSGADMRDLCRESAMESFRDSAILDQINDIQKTEIRGITYDDFLINLNVVKPSVSSDELKQYEDWNKKFGTNLTKASKVIDLVQ